MTHALPRAPTVGQVLAHRVKKYRDERRWTQQDLADEMGRLGYPINRVTLAKLEAAGTRSDNVPLREVLILAAALDVPPALLFLPLGERDRVQVTPSQAIHPHLAFNWLRGEEPFCRVNRRGHNIARNPGEWTRNAAPVRMFNQLGELTGTVQRSANAVGAAENIGDAHRLEVAEVRRDEALRRLAQHLDYMDEAGVDTPPLPDEWQVRMVELRAEED